MLVVLFSKAVCNFVHKNLHLHSRISSTKSFTIEIQQCEVYRREILAKVGLVEFQVESNSKVQCKLAKWPVIYERRCTCEIPWTSLSINLSKSISSKRASYAFPFRPRRRFVVSHAKTALGNVKVHRNGQKPTGLISHGGWCQKTCATKYMSRHSRFV